MGKVNLNRSPLVFAVLSILLAVPAVNGYMYLQDYIPNGKKVPHPCKPNVLWEGVGHFKVAGSGDRNPFGIDFNAAGKTWTAELCRKDSDGDGMTNGQELGDPDCTWTQGAIPKFQTDLTHPGICEPMDSPTCQQKAFSGGPYRTQLEWAAAVCKYDEFVCEALNEQGVRNQTLRVPVTQVRAEETTYNCGIFDFGDLELDVHLVATTPVIDNRHVMHHIVMFGCTGDTSDRPLGESFTCGMTAHRNCQDFLSIWTVGQNGECMHPNAGIRMGLHGYKRVAFQFHWNNPQKLSTYNDSSGMTLYYTTNRRPNDAGILMVGDQDFAIPPGEVRYAVESNCSASCTRSMLNQTVYVTGAWNHMHYAGVSQKIGLYRNGQLVQYLTNDATYSYDSPVTHNYMTPIEVYPGDELKTTCYFSTKDRTKTTFWGDSTQAEMCYVFIYYYPQQAIADGGNGCTTYGPHLNFCNEESRGDCDLTQFITDLAYQRTLYTNVTSNCKPFGKCLAECKAAIRAARASEGCISNPVWWTWAKNGMIDGGKRTPELLDTYLKFLGSMTSCEAELAVEDAKMDWEKQNSGDGNMQPNDTVGAMRALTSTINTLNDRVQALEMTIRNGVSSGSVTARSGLGSVVMACVVILLGCLNNHK